MKKKIVWLVILSLLCTTFGSLNVLAFQVNEDTENAFEIETVKSSSEKSEMTFGEPSINIVYPKPGYIYLRNIQFRRPFSQTAIVVDHTLFIETNYNEVDHVKFVAKRMFLKTETISWAYNKALGLNTALELNSGFYEITAIAYDKDNNAIDSDSVKIIYIKSGNKDFGVFVHTKYNGGERREQQLKIDLTEFTEMLSTGKTSQFLVTMKDNGDTKLDLRFIRTKIINNTEKVVVADLGVKTNCDTSKEYELALEVRFPFYILDGGQSSGENDPYFSAKVGYIAHSEAKINSLNTSFCFGREHINDPRVFRLSLIPDDIGDKSKITYFTSIHTVDSNGNDAFRRVLSVDFEPATELTITTIPRELKVSYDFGESENKTTKISFRAEGGVLDEIVQSFEIDPLPGYMAFDLTIIGNKEFIYECDKSYDIKYSLDSIENGNIVTFAVSQLPKTIHANWGLSLGELGDLSASAFAGLEMSSDVDELGLYFFGNPTPFLKVNNFPRKVLVEGSADILNGKGNFNITRGMEEEREIDVNLAYNEMVMTKTFELKSEFIEINWDIDLDEGVGEIKITRDSQSTIAFSSVITYKGWTFSKEIELKNTFVQLSWDIDKTERMGEVILQRDPAGGEPTLTMSIEHENWIFANTLEFKNNYIRLYWDLPTSGNGHTEFGLYTGGGEIFYNTLSLSDGGSILLQLGFGIKTDDHFYVSFDYNNGAISNFQWSGKILKLTNVNIQVNLIGEIFTIDADLNLGISGALELGFNKAVTVTFLNTATSSFKLQGNAAFHANRKLQVTWSLGESGSFTVYTYNQPLGDSFTLEFGYDPNHNNNYKYGFKLSGQNFIQITRTIQWYSENGQLKRIWVLGDLPIPGDWELKVLWNYVWYNVPWDA